MIVRLDGKRVQMFVCLGGVLKGTDLLWGEGRFLQHWKLVAKAQVKLAAPRPELVFEVKGMQQERVATL